MSHPQMDRRADFLDGELDPRAARSVECHAHWCPNCRRMLRTLARTIGGLRALRDQPILGHEPAGDA